MPPATVRRQLVLGCQSRKAKPVTIKAWKKVPGRIVCSFCSS